MNKITAAITLGMLLSTGLFTMKAFAQSASPSPSPSASMSPSPSPRASSVPAGAPNTGYGTYNLR